MTNHFDTPSGKAGRCRMAEISRENEANIQLWKSAMLAGLNRSWTVAEEITAESIASLFIRARRERDNGRSDVALLRQAALLMRDSVFRDPHTVPSGMGRAETA
jgi:hypothetical protein